MFHIKTKGTSGERHAEAEAVGILLAGKQATLADAAVAVSELDTTTGIVLVEDTTNGDSAVISVHNAGGTPALGKVAGVAGIAVAKDTASSVNVYIEDGVIKVQNSTGAEIDVVLKAYA